MWLAWRHGLYTWMDRVPVRTELWWWSSRTGTPMDLFWAMLGLSVLTFFPLFAETIYRRRFGRSPSPEMFFFRIFLLTLPFQSVRLILPLLSATFPAASWGLLAGKISWFSRFIGISALLGSGVFSADIPLRHSGAVLSTAALAALAVAVMLPLDVTQMQGNLFFRSRAEESLALISLSLQFLGVFSMLGTAILRKNARYGVLTLSLFSVAVGTDLLYFATMPLIAPGTILLILGTIAFSRQIRRIYQWI